MTQPSSDWGRWATNEKTPMVQTWGRATSAPTSPAASLTRDQRVADFLRRCRHRGQMSIWECTGNYFQHSTITVKPLALSAMAVVAIGFSELAVL